MENNKEKIVAFVGHRAWWKSVDVDDKLKVTIEELINKGYNTFFDGNHGAFDKKCLKFVLELKHKYPHIKVVKIFAYYHPEKRFELEPWYDESIYPDLETVHYKQTITKRNEWIVDNCDILVCHIVNTSQSGAFNMVKYARKIGKPIIYL